MSITASRPPQAAADAAPALRDFNSIPQSRRAVLHPQSFGELVQFAQMAAKSGYVPTSYANKPEAIMIAVQMGSELGLAPMQSLINIAVVNGRPSVWGDAMPGLVKQSGVCKDIIERIEGEGEAMKAVCIAHRHGAEPVTSEFSVADAKKAGLWGKAGPWQQYPKRMLQMRARGFALRDAFPDVLRGLISSEEAADIPVDTFAGPTIVARAEPVADAPEPPKRTVREILRDKLAVAESREDIVEATRIPAVAKILSEGPEAQRVVLNEMLSAAYHRFSEDVVDDADTTEEAA